MNHPDSPAPNQTARVRELFLRDDNAYGCAETALVVLQEAYGLPEATDSSAAMALNGGVAYSGGICGAVSGAALAIGRLASRHIDDHQEAKRTARGIVQAIIADFDAEFGSHECVSLTGYDLSAPDQHDAFILAGTWRRSCTRQIEFVIARMEALAADHGWSKAADPAEGGDSSP